MRLNRRNLGVELCALALVFAGCTSPSKVDSHESNADGSIQVAEEGDVAPIEFDPLTVTESSSACIKQRSGMVTAPAVPENEGEALSSYYLLNIQCLLADPAAFDVIPAELIAEIWKSDHLSRIGKCLSKEHGWPSSDDVSVGVGGASRPANISDHAARESVENCESTTSSD